MTAGHDDPLAAAEGYLVNGWRFFDLGGPGRVFVWDPSTEYLARVTQRLAWSAPVAASASGELSSALSAAAAR